MVILPIYKNVTIGYNITIGYKSIVNSAVVKILGSLPSKQISVALVTASEKCRSCEAWKRVQDISPLMDSNGKEPIT